MCTCRDLSCCQHAAGRVPCAWCLPLDPPARMKHVQGLSAAHTPTFPTFSTLLLASWRPRNLHARPTLQHSALVPPISPCGCIVPPRSDRTTLMSQHPLVNRHHRRYLNHIPPPTRHYRHLHVIDVQVGGVHAAGAEGCLRGPSARKGNKACSRVGVV